MFKHTLQSSSSLLCVLHASGSSPLQLWSAEAGKGGAVTAGITDETTGLATIDITGPSTAATYIACPPEQAVRAGGGLSVRLPALDLLLKPLPVGGGAGVLAHTSIEITVRDAAGGMRRLRASTGQRAPPRVTPFLAALPLRLEPAASGWCRVRLDVAALLARSYPGSPQFAEVLRLRIHAACRLRCVYFADRAYEESELPPEFRLVVAGAKKVGGAGGVLPPAPPVAHV